MDNPSKDVVVEIGGENLKLRVDGATFYGPDDVLLLKDDNLIAGLPWHDRGYTIERFMNDSSYAELQAGVLRLMAAVVEKAVGQVPADFALEHYHEAVSSDEMHAQVISYLREGFPLEAFPLPIQVLEARVSEICGLAVQALNPQLPDQRFYVRVVRPNGKPDNNPPHRDVWLDYYRNCINIYIPLCGSNEKSSLPLVPGSHLWKESDIERTVGGAKIQGYSYRVPSVTAAEKPLNFIRPNPQPNEVMAFSPYLIHGGGVNWNHDLTRMSLEMRFFRHR